MAMSASAEQWRRLTDLVAQWVASPPADVSSVTSAEWELLPSVCATHGVASLLHIEGPSASVWPARMRDWLAHQYTNNHARISRMAVELADILMLFEGRGVQVMAMKGLAIGERVYQDIGSRPMNDIDLLIDACDLDTAASLLAELGYARGFGGWKHTKFQRPDNMQIVDETSEHPDNPRILEVHPRCVEKLVDDPVDITEQVWAGAYKSTLAGCNAWLMDVDDLWGYLLLHGTHHILHNNFRLLQLLDMARLVPLLKTPQHLVQNMDARASYAPLVLLERYFPSELTARLRQTQRARLTPGFVQWADSLDLYTVSYLNPAPWRV